MAPPPPPRARNLQSTMKVYRGSRRRFKGLAFRRCLEVPLATGGRFDATTVGRMRHKMRYAPVSPLKNKHHWPEQDIGYCKFVAIRRGLPDLQNPFWGDPHNP